MMRSAPVFGVAKFGVTSFPTAQRMHQDNPTTTIPYVLPLDLFKQCIRPPAPPPTVIDHTAFPHIIDEILGYATNDVLLRFRATCTEYYWRITPNIGAFLQIKPYQRGNAKSALALADGDPLFTLNKPIAPRSIAWKTPFKMLKGRKHYKTKVYAPCTVPTTYVAPTPYSSVCEAPHLVAPAISVLDLGPRETTPVIAPLLSYLRVLDIDARNINPALLAPLATSLLRATPGRAPVVPLVRLLDFPSGGWGAACPIVADTLVIFMMDIRPCPPHPNPALSDEPCLITPGTKRVVVNLCAQHMLSYANLNALYDIPDSVTELVFHLADASHLFLPCRGPFCDIGYAYLGHIIGHSLAGGRREVFVTGPGRKWHSVPQSATLTVATEVAAPHQSSSPTTAPTTTTTAPHPTPTPTQAVHRPYMPAFDPRDLLTSAAEHYLENALMSGVEAALGHLNFIDTNDYRNAVGEQEWLWEARP